MNKSVNSPGKKRNWMMRNLLGGTHNEVWNFVVVLSIRNRYSKACFSPL